MNNKYIFETDDLNEMNLVVNKYKLLSALEELKSWRRDLYKGYDNDIKHLSNGNIYTQQELLEDINVPRDEHGIIKDCKSIYYVDDIINRIDEILYDVNIFLN